MQYWKEVKSLTLTLPDTAHYIIEQNFGGTDYKKAVWLAWKIHKACYVVRKQKDTHVFDIAEQKMPMRVSRQLRHGWSTYNYDVLNRLVDEGKIEEEIFEPYVGDTEYLQNQFEQYGYRWEIIRELPFVAISSYTFSAVVGKDYKRLLNKLDDLGLIAVFVGSEPPENPKAKYPRIYLWTENLPDKITSTKYRTKTIRFQDDGVCWRNYLLQENALSKYIVANSDVRYAVNDLYKMRLSEEFMDAYQKGGYIFLREQFGFDYDRKANKKYLKLNPYERKPYPTIEDYKKQYTTDAFLKDIADDIRMIVDFVKTPVYAQHRFVSTCIGQRIHNPICYIYSGLRPFLRTNKIKQMASIDLNASIPTVLAELMHRDGIDCEFTRLIAEHQDVYVVIQERLKLQDRNEAKVLLNTCINSDRWAWAHKKLEKVFPEVAEFIIGYRKSFVIPDDIKEDIRRWDIQRSGKEKYKQKNKPQTPYQQYYLRDQRGVQDGEYLWENVIKKGSFTNSKKSLLLKPVNTPRRIHTLTYRQLFTFESKLMQKIVARIKKSDVGKDTDVLLLHDAIYFDSEQVFRVKLIVESVVMDEFTLCCPVVDEPEIYDGRIYQDPQLLRRLDV